MTVAKPIPSHLRLVVDNTPAPKAHALAPAPAYVPAPVDLLDPAFDGDVATDLAAFQHDRDLRDYWGYVPFGYGE